MIVIKSPPLWFVNENEPKQRAGNGNEEKKPENKRSQTRFAKNTKEVWLFWLYQILELLVPKRPALARTAKTGDS